MDNTLETSLVITAVVYIIGYLIAVGMAMAALATQKISGRTFLYYSFIVTLPSWWFVGNAIYIMLDRKTPLPDNDSVCTRSKR